MYYKIKDFEMNIRNLTVLYTKNRYVQDKDRFLYVIIEERNDNEYGKLKKC